MADMMEVKTLKDTVSKMCSDDYKERFKAEYHQLRIRCDGLKKMLFKWDVGELDFKPTCPRSLYTLQLDSMELYLAVLEARAGIEGVIL